VEPPPQYDGDLFSRHRHCNSDDRLCQDLELTAGLAAIGLLTAIYHPIVRVMLLAHAVVGCEVGINKVWGNLDLGFSGTTALIRFGVLMQHTPTNCDLLAETT
jgi:hypothetical protein